MFKRAIGVKGAVCLCLMLAALLPGCGSSLPEEERTDDVGSARAMEDGKDEEDGETSDAPEAKETSAAEPETAGAAAETRIYEGRYFDESFYQYVDMPAEESPLVYCEIMISHVTDTSFDFTVNEIVMATGESSVLVPAATAVIQEEGSKAVYEGDGMTLTFVFPDDRDTFPQHLEISGLEQTENKVYMNNTIPGHESG